MAAGAFVATTVLTGWCSPVPDIIPAALLEFEAQPWIHAGAKEREIRERFGLSPARYHQLLNLFIDTPEAMATDPVTTRRLQRLRSGARSWRRAG